MSEETQKRNPFLNNNLFAATANVKRPFKMSFEGFAGDGKSYTMGLVVLGVWIAEGRKKNVAMMDTERSSKQYVSLFAKEGLTEGKNWFVTPSRSLADFTKILKMCEEDDAIFMIDTATHLYEEMVQAYLKANDRKKVLVQDHASLKPMWKERFSTPYVNASCHTFFTGRAAWEYAMEENDETGKKEFYKSGIKMRGDNETAFEPDLLVLMQRIEEINGKDVEVFRQATIMKDRSTLLDGQVLKRPTFKDFEPVYRYLCQGTAERGTVKETSMEAELRTSVDRDWLANRKRAEIYFEEIEGLFRSYLPGQGPKEKKVQSDIFYTVFTTRSASAIGAMRAEELDAGRRAIEYLLQDLVSKGPWLVKMQEDKTQSFDLANYVKEQYAAYLKSGKTQPADDEIPFFVPPEPKAA
jgi:hypothetical protein